MPSHPASRRSNSENEICTKLPFRMLTLCAACSGALARSASNSRGRYWPLIPLSLCRLFSPVVNWRYGFQAAGGSRHKHASGEGLQMVRLRSATVHWICRRNRPDSVLTERRCGRNSLFLIGVHGGSPCCPGRGKWQHAGLWLVRRANATLWIQSHGHSCRKSSISGSGHDSNRRPEAPASEGTVDVAQSLVLGGGRGDTRL